MSKAKELAIQTQELLEHKRGDWHDLKASVYALIEAVLSEPDPKLKGWIQVTDNCDETILVNLSKVETVVNLSRETNPKCKSCIVINGDKWETVECKESYDELKQLIKGAS